MVSGWPTPKLSERVAKAAAGDASALADVTSSPKADAGKVNELIAKAKQGRDPHIAGLDDASLRGPVQNALTAGLSDDQVVALLQKAIHNTPEERASRVTDQFTAPDAAASKAFGGVSGGKSTLPSGGSTVTGVDDQLHVADTILRSAMGAAPNPGDPKYAKDPTAYTADYDEWMTIVQHAAQTSKLLKETKAGIVQLKDGSVITQDQFDGLGPLGQSQVVKFFADQNTDAQNSYNDLLNKLDLSEYQTRVSAAEAANSAASMNFQNQLRQWEAQLSLGQANQDTATKQIDRQLKGMSESRSRADLALTAEMKAGPLASPNGQTEFSPQDLGGGIARLAGFGGAAPGVPFLKFTGTQQIDPGALLTAGDQALGVTGALPEIPALGVGAPPAPPMLGAPSFAFPQLRRPTPPSLLTLPTTSGQQQTQQAQQSQAAAREYAGRGAVAG